MKIPWISILLTASAWKRTNTAVCVCAGIGTWRPTRHELDSSLDASSCEFLFSFNTVLLCFIELATFFVEIDVTGLQMPSADLALCRVSPAHESVDKKTFWAIPWPQGSRHSQIRLVRKGTQGEWTMARCTLCSRPCGSLFATTEN